MVDQAAGQTSTKGVEGDLRRSRGLVTAVERQGEVGFGLVLRLPVVLRSGRNEAAGRSACACAPAPLGFGMEADSCKVGSLADCPDGRGLRRGVDPVQDHLKGI